MTATPEHLTDTSPVSDRTLVDVESEAFAVAIAVGVVTLIVGGILFAMGTGPIKGFAVTLSLGILTSMFTAIIVTRAMVNLIYGGRDLKKLWI